MTTLYDLEKVCKREFRKSKNKFFYLEEKPMQGIVIAHMEAKPDGKAFQNALKNIYMEKVIAVGLIIKDVRTNQMWSVSLDGAAFEHIALRTFIETDAEKERLKKCVDDCHKQFSFYVNLHMAKPEPDFAKAAANYEFVLRCRYAMNK